MLIEHDEIVKCLKTKTVEELTSTDFGTPSFLSSMGPSRDGILIPADFGTDVASLKRKRAQTEPYQVC